MSSWKVECDDVIHWAETYDGPPFHAALMDPPYHLYSPISKSGSRPTDEVSEGKYNRFNQGGFMGKQWDGGDITFQPETWAALAEHLLPGAFVMAFGGSRTYHRLACALEDAGLIIHPAISYVFGSGFPKATRIDTQVDKARRRDYVEAAIRLGLEIPDNNHHDWTKQDHIPGDKWWEKFKAVLSPDDWQRIEREVLDTVEKPPGWYTQGDEYDITAPATPLAATWAGHRYGLQALKPAAEFICVAQKPYAGKPVDSIVETGAGALWVDGARIPGAWQWGTQTDIRGNGYGTKRPSDGDIYAKNIESHPGGRWPANFLLSHLPPDADGNGGCRKVGTRRVERGGGVPQTTEWANGRPYDGGYKERKITFYGTPDGLELVDAWECEEGWSATVFCYAYRNHALSALDGAEFLLDQTQAVLQNLREHSMNDNNLLQSASEVYHSGHKLSEVSGDDLLHAVLYALKVAEVPSFQFDCLSCRHSCGELLHRVLGACQDGPASLLDVLGRVLPVLSELLHSPQNQCPCHPSSSDGSGQSYEPWHTEQSNISDVDHARVTLPEIACCNEGNSQKGGSEQFGQIERNQENNTCDNDNREIPCCNVGRIALVKLLCLLSFDLAWRFLLPAHIIQRSEIVVNSSSCPVRALGEQSGERTSNSGKPFKRNNADNYARYNCYGQYANNEADGYYGDTGTAARFFYQATWEYEIAERLAGAEPFYYCAKASRRERDAGCGEFEPQEVECNGKGSMKYHGQTGNPNHEKVYSRNPHPTVKPIALTRYLATLLLPPPAYAPRRILIPFFGVGSEAIGAGLAGWEEIVGIEREPEYAEIGQARLRHWLANLQLELTL